KTYQLCDPAPPTVAEMVALIADATERRVVPLPITVTLGQAAMRRVPLLRRVFGVPVASLAYFVHPTHYLCPNTLADLEGSGIRCPRFDTYVDKLVAFVRAHPEIGSKAMV